MVELSIVPYALVIAFVVSFGLMFGSFLNVVIYRLPRGMNVAYPPSSCPACGARIRPWHNVPVLGWLVLRGRAVCCGAKIGIRYPTVELLGGLLAWAIYERVVAPLPMDVSFLEALGLFVVHLALGLALVAATFIDFEHMILPDELTLGGAVLGVLSLPIREINWLDAAIGGSVGFLIVWLPFIFLYSLLRGHAGMGLGDAKLLLLAGIWFGWEGALFALAAGAIQGTIAAIAVYIATGRIEEPASVQEEREQVRVALAELEGEALEELQREIAKDPLASEPEAGLAKARLAFGPFLCLAILEYLFVGEWLVSEYLNVMRLS
jgi:leader peptidase (prepilin peptidase)/N-methyltransferase